MSGNSLGGKRAAATNKRRYGPDFYTIIGGSGGRQSKDGGFGSKKIGSDGLTGSERARLVGSRGGKASSRRKNG